MDKLMIPVGCKNMLQDFAQGLKDTYRDELTAVILYGSAASSEFVEGRSNLNLLAVLKSTDLVPLKKSADLLRKFKKLNVLFLSDDYIAGSTDVFPIEFLDMRENHYLIFGKDILSDIQIDTRNLRFQCEQEIKAKLLKLKQAYLKHIGNNAALGSILISSITPILHILRNVLRLRGKEPPYLKQDVLRELAEEFKIDLTVWSKILSARNKQTKLTGREAEGLFIVLVKDLEGIASVVDKS
jgi:predicted nucleotidyltransferase